MRVKIKKKTRPGDQLDYSLVTGDVYGHINEDAQPRDPLVKNTISKVPRSEANIEAEGGEHIYGDLDQDGMMENSRVVGKRHHAGGVPLNIPDGSFVFSDTRKLKIKDKETLEYFGKKRESTPAKIASQYNLNEYNALLKDPDTDQMTKYTADLMLKNNKRKLAELALVQEGMKGFPNGIPSIAESVIPQMQKGGTYTTKDNLNRMGQQEPFKSIGSAWDALVRGYNSPARNVSDPLYSNRPKRFDNPVQVPFVQPIIDSEGVPLPTPAIVNDLNSTYSEASPVIKNTSKGEVKKLKKLEDFQGGGFVDEQVEGPDGKIYISRQYPDGKKVLLDENYKLIMSKDASGKVFDSKTQSTQTIQNTPSQGNTTPVTNPNYSQYANVQDLIQAKADELLMSKQIYNEFGSQYQREGVYTSDPNNQFDYEDFKLRHGEFLNKLGYDVDVFIKDIQNPATTEKATRLFQNEYNKVFEQKYGRKYFTPENGSPYGVDGKFGQVTYSAPGFRGLANLTPEPDPTTPLVPDPKIVKKTDPREIKPSFVDQGVPINDGWWLQDIANFAGSMMDNVREYRPKRQQVDLERVDSTLLDPTRQIAAIQEQAGRNYDLVQNTSEGTVARANMYANSGQGLGAVADVIGNYENQNAQIINQTNATNTQIANQETMSNVEMDDMYMTRLATLKQQKANADRELNDRRLKAFIRGSDNNLKKTLMDEVLFPQYAIDPLTFNMKFQGQKDRTITGYDPYLNPQMGAQGTQDPIALVMQQATQAIDSKKELMRSGYSREDAEWALQQVGRNVRPNVNNADNLFNLQAMYNQMFSK